ncbi:MAG: rhomboid family intramembrane serine protease [Lactobacillus sp.]|nr:rhomboid family intramembrane serine protease [Lactobacillus sp.]MCI2032216.1 rhomboid family intramembrane serine protease [Lactobacillus sp.]
MRHPYWRTRLANTPIVTYALLAITIAVFIGETLMGGSTNTLVLIAFGARWNQLIDAGQWWRFVTPAFVHIGLMHIIVNGISLYYLGAICERIFGHWRFAIIYLVSAVAGNVAGYVFAPDIPSAGASTAIFGLMGAFLMLGDSFRDNSMVRLLSQQFAMLAVINLVFNLFSSGVDISGHIGGLIGGFLIAGTVGAPQLGRMSKIRQVIMATVLIFALAALLVLGRR